MAGNVEAADEGRVDGGHAPVADHESLVSQLDPDPGTEHVERGAAGQPKLARCAEIRVGGDIPHGQVVNLDRAEAQVETAPELQAEVLDLDSVEEQTGGGIDLEGERLAAIDHQPAARGGKSGRAGQAHIGLELVEEELEGRLLDDDGVEVTEHQLEPEVGDAIQKPGRLVEVEHQRRTGRDVVADGGGRGIRIGRIPGSAAILHLRARAGQVDDRGRCDRRRAGGYEAGGEIELV